MLGEYERSFELFGTRVRLLIGEPTLDRRSPELAALEAEMALRVIDRELTRFDPASELCRLNADPRERVEVSVLMAQLIEAALEAARISGGLVDATTIGALEQAGYVESLRGVVPPALADALAVAPPRRPASVDATSRLGEIELDREGPAVRRPPGVRLDSGGIGKGLAADLIALRLGDFSSFAVDIGGDLRIGGAAGLRRTVEVAHPLGGPSLRFELVRGGVATSGLDRRLWRDPSGGYSHHLIDPGRGIPAWTGLVQTTAVAPTALAAETLAKTALLRGPEDAGAVLGDGGVAVDDRGVTHRFGELAGKVPAGASR